MTSLEPKIEKSPTHANLKILTQAPNLTSNFKTHKNVGGNFLSHVYVRIYLIYIPTKYQEN